MNSLKELCESAKTFGFDTAEELNMDSMVLMPEVREMCEANKCGNYGKNWCCPPGCGTIEENSEKLKSFKSGILVQTIGHPDDDFDIETIYGTGDIHKKHFRALVTELRRTYPDMLPLGAGTCNFCKQCAYPDPCRHPEQQISSMEAYGLWVSKVCEMSDVPYYYGKNTIAYTSCILFK